MQPLLNPLKEDLLSLYNNDYIESAKTLNKNIAKDFFATNCEPMYFTGKFDAKTVFVMLNPGASGGDYSFKKNDKNNYTNFDDFYHDHLNKKNNYGTLHKNIMDNFDLKQAAFLYNFNNSGIDIPETFWNKDISIKLKAKENVLMNKLQLELVPYLSVEFRNLFDNEKLALQNVDFFISHIHRVFDTIIANERKYVIFGAKQFYHLFLAYKTKGYGNIEFGKVNTCKIEDLKNRVSFNTIKIMHKGNQINACIAHSFPRQDLPNAYEKMATYGKLCADFYIAEQVELNK